MSASATQGPDPPPRGPFYPRLAPVDLGTPAGPRPAERSAQSQAGAGAGASAGLTPGEAGQVDPQGPQPAPHPRHWLSQVGNATCMGQREERQPLAQLGEGGGGARGSELTPRLPPQPAPRPRKGNFTKRQKDLCEHFPSRPDPFLAGTARPGVATPPAMTQSPQQRAEQAGQGRPIKAGPPRPRQSPLRASLPG